MRTIVAFLFVAVISTAQNIAESERLQKKIADHPDNMGDRTALLGYLTNQNVPLTPQQLEARRNNILWLVEHRAGANICAEPSLLLPARGRLADPAGSAEVVALWKALVAKPGARNEVIANAAIYLRALDVPAALAILDAHPNEPVLARARGLVDAAAVIGLTGVVQNLRFGSSATLRATPEAKVARLEIDTSSNPLLVGSAGLAFAQGKIDTPFDLTFGEDDVFTLAERWLRRAIELAPPGDEWKAPLGRTLVVIAGRTLDPAAKVNMLREAEPLVSDGARPDVIANLAVAEFNTGDDEAAGREAGRVLALGPKTVSPYNLAQTILGRVAAAKGDLIEAKKRLIASLTMPATIKNALFEPNMTLAQDILDAGDREAVLEFLEASRVFWKFDRGRIDRMISFVKKAPSVDLVELSKQFPGSEVIRRPAPAFEAADLDGKTWNREQLTGRVVALEFGKSPLAEKLAKDYAARGAVLLQIEDEDTKRRFEVTTNPTVVIINRRGNVIAFRSGEANEADIRNDFENGLGGANNSVALPAPKQLDSVIGASNVTLAWDPVDNAESYVVEWDSRDEKGWIFDREKTVRVIPTRETSAMLDLTGFMRIRWRVFAVPRSGQAGPASPWREQAGTPVTKNYK